MKLHNRFQPGFTIIELLVVIVVIGILAGIVAVAYNGVTKSAYSARIGSAVDDYTKILQAYKTVNGRYPVPDITMSQGYPVCLGTNNDYPAEDGYDSGACFRGSEGGSIYFLDNGFNEQLRGVASPLPSGSYPSWEMSDGSAFLRGLVYFSQTDDQGNYDGLKGGIMYYQTADYMKHGCPRGTVLNTSDLEGYEGPNFAYCIVMLE